MSVLSSSNEISSISSSEFASILVDLNNGEITIKFNTQIALIKTMSELKRLLLNCLPDSEIDRYNQTQC